MSTLMHPSRRDVDIFLETLEEEERMRQKQAAIAYARYLKREQTFHVTGTHLARLLWRGLLVAAFIGFLVWLRS